MVHDKTMNIAIGSSFRNMAGGPLQHYVTQVFALYRALQTHGHSLRLIAVEGDSCDATEVQLQRYAVQLEPHFDIQIVKREHGGPVFGSTEAPERMKALSYVGNGIFESVRGQDEVLVYVESDLIWNAHTMLRLIYRLEVGQDVIAPMIFAGESFYDIWGFRKNGVRFEPVKPYHPDLDSNGLTEVDSAGSCLVMRGEVARKCRMVEDMALVGFCKDVRDSGYHIYCDSRECVRHPA